MENIVGETASGPLQVNREPRLHDYMTLTGGKKGLLAHATSPMTLASYVLLVIRHLLYLLLNSLKTHKPRHLIH